MPRFKAGKYVHTVTTYFLSIDIFALLSGVDVNESVAVSKKRFGLVRFFEAKPILSSFGMDALPKLVNRYIYVTRIYPLYNCLKKHVEHFEIPVAFLARQMHFEDI